MDLFKIKSSIIIKVCQKNSIRDNGSLMLTFFSGLASVYSKPTFWCSTKVDVNGYHVRGPWNDKGVCSANICISYTLSGFQKHVGFCDDSCPKTLPRFFF